MSDTYYILKREDNNKILSKIPCEWVDDNKISDFKIYKNGSYIEDLLKFKKRFQIIHKIIPFHEENKIIKVYEFSPEFIINILKDKNKFLTTTLNGYEYSVNLTLKKFTVFLRDNFKCTHCGLKGEYFYLENAGNYNRLNIYGIINDEKIVLTVDHIIPKSLSGSNKLENLQTLCEKCNREKGNNLTEKDYVVFERNLV